MSTGPWPVLPALDCPDAVTVGADALTFHDFSDDLTPATASRDELRNGRHLVWADVVEVQAASPAIPAAVVAAPSQLDLVQAILVLESPAPRWG